jgi:hypothetical protein
METKGPVITAASAHNSIRSAGHTSARRNWLACLLAIAAGVAVLDPDVAGEIHFTMSTPSGGTVDPAPGGYFLDYPCMGWLWTIKAMPDSCHRFKQWVVTVDSCGSATLDNETSPETLLHLDLNDCDVCGTMYAWVCATFERIPCCYMVNICTPVHGTVSPGPGGHAYDCGSGPIPIQATPDSCYRFKQWNINGGVVVANYRAASTTMTVSGDGTLCPEFEKMGPYTVTVGTPTNGTVSPSPGNHTYDCGSGPISIHATPASCYKFDYWGMSGGVSVADSTKADTTMTVTGDGSLMPYFALLRFAVTVCAPTNGTVSPPPGDYLYYCGPLQHYDATPARYYGFKQWNTTGGVTPANRTSASTNMTVTGDGTICPVFEKKTTQVPNLIGASENDIQATLDAAGLDLGTESYGASSLQAGLVFDQDPKAGTTVEEGTEVNVTISQGPSRFYVDTHAKGKDNGTTWTDAFIHLQDALKVVAAGDEIWVAKGTYKPNEGRAIAPTIGREATFTLVKGVALYGGFPTHGGTWQQRDPLLNQTTLSGDIGKVGDANDNSYHVVVASNTDDKTVFDGFTITGGNANGDGDYLYAGGMLNYRGHLSVANCIFTGNAAIRSGAVYNRLSNAHFDNCSFIGNTCAIDTAGMLCRESNTIISNCLFANNAAGRNGGGLFLYLQGTPSIINCRFEGNSAAGGGGGAANDRSQPTFVGCVFTGNTAGGSGGGLNTGNSEDPAYVVNCTFTGNTASGNNTGGGICDANCPLTVVNSILWGNHAKSGPQLSAYTASEVQIHHCYVEGGKEKIVLGDTSTVNWGAGNITTDPLFVDADGPDNIPGTLDDRLDLGTNSPCLDAGDDTQVPADIADLDGDYNTSERLPLDIAGSPRFVDNTAAANKGIADPLSYAAIVDMGAYEHSR